MKIKLHFLVDFFLVSLWHFWGEANIFTENITWRYYAQSSVAKPLFNQLLLIRNYVVKNAAVQCAGFHATSITQRSIAVRHWMVIIWWCWFSWEAKSKSRVDLPICPQTCLPGIACCSPLQMGSTLFIKQPVTIKLHQQQKLRKNLVSLAEMGKAGSVQLICAWSTRSAWISLLTSQGVLDLDLHQHWPCFYA